MMKPILLADQFQPNATMISNNFLDHYVLKANGEYLKVFLMILRFTQSGTTPSTELLADRLEMPERDIKRAVAYWEREGVLGSQKEAAPVEAPVPKQAEPSIPAAMVDLPEKVTLSGSELAEKHQDDDFANLMFVTEMYLGHPLTSSELNSLYYIYDSLKLPINLIEYLIEYCVSNQKQNMRYIETVAISWHQKGISTIEQAKSQPSPYSKDYYTILKAMGLSGTPAPAQITFIEKWLNTDCFSIQVILEACNRTMTTIGKPSFPYIDKILSSWKKQGLKSVQQVLDYEKSHPVYPAKQKPEAAVPRSNHNFQERSYDYDALEQHFIHKINQ